MEHYIYKGDYWSEAMIGSTSYFPPRRDLTMLGSGTNWQYETLIEKLQNIQRLIERRDAGENIHSDVVYEIQGASEMVDERPRYSIYS